MDEVISLRVRNRRQRCFQVAGQIETPRPPDPILRRPCADREEKRVTHGHETGGNPTAMRYVTKATAIPTGRKPDGDHAMSNAERQARYRARRSRASTAAPSAVRSQRPADRRSRPQRWRAAVAELLSLQAEYADWLTALPESLQDSQTADSLEIIVDLDLAGLADIDLPRGYGRD
jgi:hypothetical protein